MHKQTRNGCLSIVAGPRKFQSGVDAGENSTEGKCRRLRKCTKIEHMVTDEIEDLVINRNIFIDQS